MSTNRSIWRVLGMALLLASSAVLAQGKMDLGKHEYDSNCASCHGLDGKGVASTWTS